jgi:quercetin dioxygenase-like cupin family protein
MSTGWKTIDHLIPGFSLLLICALVPLGTAAQVFDPDTIHPKEEFENAHVQRMYTDSNASVFVIWAKQSVARHYHANHTEYVTILRGAGDFLMDTVWSKVGAGDQIIIPAGTPHEVKVTSTEPMKVISIQTPEFAGEDRIYLED